MKMYQVELKGRKEKYSFDDREVAEQFAIIQSAFNGFKYRITEVRVSREKV